MNIDLKGFTPRFYEMVGAGKNGLDTVKRNIAAAAGKCHVEVTTLVIPGENDGEDEIRSLASFLGGIDKELPLHVTRFFPCYRMNDRGPTPVATVKRLAEVASEELNHVYVGNC